MTQPNVLPLVLYRDVRPEKSGGAKLLGQCSLIQLSGNQTVLRGRGGSNVALLPEQIEGVGKGAIEGQVRFVSNLFMIAT
jgi:hypothetical protein